MAGVKERMSDDKEKAGGVLGFTKGIPQRRREERSDMVNQVAGTDRMQLEMEVNNPENMVRPEAREYDEIAHGAESVSIADLMAAGVTAEDIQAAYNEHPDMLPHIKGGPTMERLATSADGVVNQYEIRDGKRKVKSGRCKAGVDNIFSKAGVTVDNRTRSQNEYKRARSFQGGTSGGTCYYYLLEQDGDFVTFDVKNSCYDGNSANNTEMNEITKNVPPGTVVSIDCIDDNSVRKKLGDTNGGKWGHVMVRMHDGQAQNFGTDFRQTRVADYGRYGEYVHFSVSKDSYVPREYAEEILAKKQYRESQGNGYEHPNVRKRERISRSKARRQQARGRGR